jgi:hypothetical protein
MIIERIEWHLDNWVKSMQSDDHGLGFPSKSLVMLGGVNEGINRAVWGNEFDSMCDSADSHSANTMNGIIDSLSKPQKTAIEHKWLHIKLHYPSHESDLEEAYNIIGKLADKRGLI